MDHELEKRTEAFLKQKLDGSRPDASPEAMTYRLEHSYRVADIGRQIARREGFDETEITIACLLHDVSYCERFGENGWQEHGRRAAQIARPFLETLGLPEDRIGEICFGIAIHVDDKADFPGERTPFALTVGDADNIDRFDVYRIHETLCREGFLEKEYDEKLAYVEKRLVRLRELKQMPMGTRSAEEIWRERLSFYIAFYEKLAAQLRCSRELLPPDGSEPSVRIEQVAGKDRKEQIARDILSALPDWFGIPQSTAAYVSESGGLPFWAAFDGDRAAGFLTLKQTGPKAAEIAVMGVLSQYHRRGVGTALWEAAKAWAKAQGFLYLQVKTVAEGHYPEYDRTNAFYRALGFAALECFPTLWDAANPCQIYVQYIGD